jgi:hypothetical protein
VGPFGTSTGGLRVHELPNIAELVPNRRPVDAPEWAAYIQAPFILEHLDAAAPDGGIYLLVDPGPWNSRHLREVDRLGNAAHCCTILPDGSRRRIVVVPSPLGFAASEWPSKRSPRTLFAEDRNGAFSSDEFTILVSFDLSFDRKGFVYLNRHVGFIEVVDEVERQLQFAPGRGKVRV